MESAAAALMVLKQTEWREYDSHVLDVLSLLLFHALAPLGLPPLVALNELGQIARLLRHANKLVLEQFAGGWALEVLCLSAGQRIGSTRPTSRGSR